MPAVITSNKKNTSLVVHVASSNSGNIVVAGNSSTTNVNGTSVCVALGDEVLEGAYITQAIWGCDGTGHIQILRGANLVAVYDSTGQQEYAGTGMPINVYPAANVVVNLVGSANSYIIFELQKTGDFVSEYQQN